MKLDFDKIVIWGHKIRNLNEYIHTHSWVNGGFYKGFKKLGHTTYWFDDKNYDKNMNYSKTLFLTMGNKENKNMPILVDSYYIFHNSNIPPFYEKVGISKKNYMVLQVYTHDCKTRNLTRVFDDDPFQLYNLNQHIIYFPWATDLFPEDIEKNIKRIRGLPVKKVIRFVGMIIQPWPVFAKAARRKGIFLTKVGGYDKQKVTPEENQRLIQESFIAPTIVCKFQEEKGYIPCRIFKNISAGKYGVTNSATVNELFFNELIYDHDVEKLFQKSYLMVKDGKTDWGKLEKHMRFVAEKHTYLNRCQTLLDIFKRILNHNT